MENAKTRQTITVPSQPNNRQRHLTHLRHVIRLRAQRRYVQFPNPHTSITQSPHKNPKIHFPNTSLQRTNPSNTRPPSKKKPPGPSRCFPFWQELLACYVVNTTNDDDSGKKKCLPALEDYYECLHHKKEVRSLYTPPPPPKKKPKKKNNPIHLTQKIKNKKQAAKTRALQAAYRKALVAHPRGDTPKPGAIRSLGLLDAEEDTRAVLESSAK
jgi:NADH dehydrogenase (ubiquinone) Fe-S protein 5